MFSLYTFLRCVEFEFLFVPLKMPKLMQVKKKFKSSSPIFLPSASWALLQQLLPLQMAAACPVHQHWQQHWLQGSSLPSAA